MVEKKKRAGKNADAELKKQELARLAEQQRFVERQEQLRKDEEDARHRLEDVERQLMNDHIRRELSIRSSVAERLLAERYSEYDRAHVEALEQREAEILQLKAKISGQVQAQNALEAEKESVLRRCAMISNELELSQMRELEVESAVEEQRRSHDGALSALEQRYAELEANLTRLRVEHQRLDEAKKAAEEERDGLLAVTEHHALTFASDLGRQENGDVGVSQSLGSRMLAVGESCASDAESAVLLKVLHGEVEKYKELSSTLQVQVDRKEREEEKASVLMGILNSQLDSSREENKRLHDVASERREELEAVQQQLSQQKSAHRQLREVFDKAESATVVKQRQLLLEVDVHKTQAEEKTRRLEEAEKELRTLRTTHDDYRNTTLRREQDDFKANTALKAELEQHKKSLQKALEEQEAMKEEFETKKTLQKAEIDSLKSRLTKLQEMAERKEREAYVSISTLTKSAEKLDTQLTTTKRKYEREETGLRADFQRVTAELESVQAQLEAKRALSEEVEKEYFEKLVFMTACHDAKHTEVEELKGRLAEREKSYTDNIIFLNAEKEALKAKVAQLNEQMDQRQREHVEHVTKISADLKELRERMEGEMHEHVVLRNEEKHRAEASERLVEELRAEVASWVEKFGEADRVNREVKAAIKGETRDLKAELTLAKRTIERLEGSMGMTLGYKDLAERNERLGKELATAQNEVRVLSHALALHAAGDTPADRRIEQLKDLVAEYEYRMEHYEREHRVSAALIRRFCGVLSRHSIMEELATELEVYNALTARRPNMLQARGGTDDVQGDALHDTMPAAARLGDASAADGSATIDTQQTLPKLLKPTTFGNVDKYYIPRKPTSPIQPSGERGLPVLSA